MKDRELVSKVLQLFPRSIGRLSLRVFVVQYGLKYRGSVHDDGSHGCAARASALEARGIRV